MAEPFFKLSAADQKDAVEFAASQLGRPAHLLEKDAWVVWALRTLFEAPVGTNLVFKGGTSLSKAFGAINRFSEDVDLTYDIRAIAPDLVGDSDNPVPSTRSQAKKWTKEIRDRLPGWIDKTILPLIDERLQVEGLTALVHRDGDNLSIDYTAVSSGTGYVRPTVLLEFGARSTGEPAKQHAISCDAAPALADVEFPTANPRVMHAQRTFWEKATAIHVYCKRGTFRGADRYARHWYDLVCLDTIGIADVALADRALADAVAKHKSHFFEEKDQSGELIDYESAVHGALCLVPNGDPLEALREDYRRMLDDGLLFDEPESFDTLMKSCTDLEQRANT